MKNYKLNGFFQFLFSFFFILGILLMIWGFNDKKIVKLSYAEDNSIKYNVYLKENNFFDTPYLGENKTYIASLIDYVDIDFNYSIKFNEKLSGNSKYKYVAIVRANKKDSTGYYWEKEYDLTELKDINVNDSDNLKVNDNIKVKYGTYNDILNQFKREYGLNTTGELKVVMRISNIVNFEEVNRPISIDSEIGLSIPLLEQALEVSINKEATNEKDILTIEEKSDSIEYKIYKVFGICIMISCLLAFIEATRNRKKYKNKNKYDLTLEKFLKNYDSIIANTNGLDIIDGLKKIEISSFEELLDVYNEVRMPINYYQDTESGESDFIIINDDIAWVYTLRKKDFLKGDHDAEN